MPQAYEQKNCLTKYIHTNSKARSSPNNFAMGSNYENESHNTSKTSMPVKVPMAQKCKKCDFNYETPMNDVMRYEIATWKMYERIVRHRIKRCMYCGGMPLDCKASNDKMEDACKCRCECKKREKEKEDMDEDIFPIDI